MFKKLSDLKVGDFFQFPYKEIEYEVCAFLKLHPHNPEICIYYDPESNKYYCCLSFATVEQF